MRMKHAGACPGLISPVGRPDSPYCLQAAKMGSVTAVPAWHELLKKCGANDYLLSQLLAQRDQALHACRLSVSCESGLDVLVEH